MTQSGRGERIPALDGLRALAIAAVIAYHAATEVSAGPLGAWGVGSVGVTLFFVISGFLITGQLLKGYARDRDIGLGRFWGRRLVRLLPAYAVFLSLSAAADAAVGRPWTLGVSLASLYGLNYYNAIVREPATIAHGWSLAIEEQFYLVWPVLLLLALHHKRNVARWLAAFIVAVLVWRSVACLGLGIPERWIYNAFDTRADALAIGCLLAVRPPPGHARSWWPVALGLGLVLTRLGPAGYRYSAGFTVEALLCGGFVWACVDLRRADRYGWLEWGWLRYLGHLSYSLYLWHLLGLNIGRHLTVFGWVGEVVAGIAASLALAAMSYAYVERPFLAWRDRRWPSPSAKPQTGPPLVVGAGAGS